MLAMPPWPLKTKPNRAHWPWPPTKWDETSFTHLFVVFRLGRTFYYLIQMHKYSSAMESLYSHGSIATNFDPFNLNPKK
jgi:hypothetical protein